MAIELIEPSKLAKQLEALAEGERIPDGGGLYVKQVRGTAFWRFDYTSPEGKRNTLSFGRVRDVSVKQARAKAQAERNKLVGDGVDPMAERKAKREARKEMTDIQKLKEDGKAIPGTVRFYAEKLAKAKTAPDANGITIWSKGYHAKFVRTLECHVFPSLGDRMVKDVQRRDVLALCEALQNAGKRTAAHLVLLHISSIFDMAVNDEAITENTLPLLRKVLLPVHTRSHSSLVGERSKSVKRIGELMRAIAGYQGQLKVRTALLVGVCTFQRPENLREMRWAHIDLEAAEWIIPAPEMKGSAVEKADPKNAHLVPLASQVVSALRELHQFTGHGEYVFPNNHGNGRHMSDNTLNTALRAMGFPREELVVHGFRSMALTQMQENSMRLPNGDLIDFRWIEAQLAHAKTGPLGDAYDRAQFHDQRRIMMQVWADWLMMQRDGNVIALRAAA